MRMRFLASALLLAAAVGVASAADAKVKFTLWHSYVGADQRAEFMADRMAAFRAAHPEIEIDEQLIPRDQYQTKLKTMAAAGELPDAFLLWPNAMTAEFAKAGLLADINDLLAANPAWKNAFSPRALDELTVNGKTYSAAEGVSLTSIVFYNKAIFAKYGVKYPTNYAELKNAITAFAKKGVIPIADGNKPKWPAQSTIFSCLANRVTGTEWLENAIAKKGGAKFTDAVFVDALTKLKEITDLGAFNKDYNTIDNVQMRSYYYKGEAAMMIDGSWALADLIANAPADVKANTELGVFPSFGGKGDPNVMCGVAATGFVINAKASAAQKAAIGALIMFLSGEESQKLFPKYNVPISLKSIAIDKASLDPIYAKMLDLIAAHPLVTVYDSALNSEMASIVNDGLQAVMIGQQKPADLAKQLQAALK
jgi:raffinose/stachyose/melibiose transport system substrate-binding protein